MIIQELKPGQYVKEPDATEKQLLNVVNRFFNSDMDEFEKSKEAIILEVQRRIKPLIINIVKKVAWEQGKEIFEPMITELVDKIIEEQLGNIKDLVNQLKNNLIKHKLYQHVVSDTVTSTLTLPADSLVVDGSDVLLVKVNGMQQNRDRNYTVSIRDKYIDTIIFDEPFDLEDVIDIECWVYSDLSNTGGSGGTP